MTAADFQTVLPEVVLALFAMGALMAGAFGGKDRLAGLILWATAGLMVALSLWLGYGNGAGTARTAFHGMFVDDTFARFAKITVLLAAAAVLIMSHDHMARHGQMRFEFPILISLAVLGMCVMVSAGDLIALYLGFEMQSLALYVIAAMRRDSLHSSEAGLKYYVLGALSSGLLLYGASLVYGYAGTTLFSGIIAALADGAPLGLLIGLVFLFAGLAFKISAAPFHMWTPDVYEGSPTAVTAFFATVPKMATICLIARVALDAFGSAPAQWTQVFAALSVASMFLGAIAGIAQTDFKRLMAYSSITHMGFAMIGLAAGTAGGIESMLLYMVIYVAMNIGTFAFILSMERDGLHVADLRGLNMFAKREPAKALALMVLLFSLAGVPPLVGFFAKYVVLKAAIDADMVWLAVLGVIASVIAAFYYLRIVFYMYFGAEHDPVESRMAPVQWVVLAVSALVMVVGSMNLFGLEPVAEAAARALAN